MQYENKTTGNCPKGIHVNRKVRMRIMRVKKKQKNKERCRIKQIFLVVCAARASSDFSHARVEEGRGSRTLNVCLSAWLPRP